MKKTKHIVVGAFGLILVLMAGFAMAEKQETKTLSRAVIKIDTLTCGACFSTINTGLAPLEGYSGMGANLFRKLIAVDFSEPLTADKLSEKLIEIGYPGKLESVDAISEKESFVYLDSRRTGSVSGGSGSCCSTQDPGNPDTSGRIPPQEGSCCTLPGGSQSTQNF